MNAEITKNNVRFVARQLGFDDCRIAAATRAPHADSYLKWVEEGNAGDMGWLEKNVDRRCDPREVLAGCKSIVSLALNYLPAKKQPRSDYRIARYSWNDDYHDLIQDKLKDLDLAMQDMGGLQRYYVDTGPVLERDFASASGLGWNGKSTVQIHRKLGTWFFLAELLLRAASITSALWSPPSVCIIIAIVVVAVVVAVVVVAAGGVSPLIFRTLTAGL